MILIYILIILLCYIFYDIKKKDEVNIKIEKSFTRHYDLPATPITCKKEKKEYICNLMYNKSKKYDGIIYNGNLKNIPLKPNFTNNIIMASEKLSQVKHMIDIGKGKKKNIKLAVDYRLFNNKYHISYPIYSYYNLNKFITEAKSNYGNISLFLKRKNVVYIQKVSYYNRQYIVKEFMKYIPIDSYGNDLNNIKWPSDVPRNNKIDILKRYKFCIAIENSVTSWKIGTKYEASTINNDYVTEKLTDCLLAGSIPIYFGPKTINLFIPNPNSIINFSNFKSIRDATNYIKKIMYNKYLIESHLQWHNNISREWWLRFAVNYSFNYCKICNAIKK